MWGEISVKITHTNVNVKSANKITAKRVARSQRARLRRRKSFRAHAYIRGGAWHKHGGGKIQNVIEGRRQVPSFVPLAQRWKYIIRCVKHTHNV